jgi:hypothetical protein
MMHPRPYHLRMDVRVCHWWWTWLISFSISMVFSTATYERIWRRWYPAPPPSPRWLIDRLIDWPQLGKSDRAQLLIWGAFDRAKHFFHHPIYDGPERMKSEIWNRRYGVESSKIFYERLAPSGSGCIRFSPSVYFGIVNIVKSRYIFTRAIEI